MFLLDQCEYKHVEWRIWHRRSVNTKYNVAQHVAQTNTVCGKLTWNRPRRNERDIESNNVYEAIGREKADQHKRDTLKLHRYAGRVDDLSISVARLLSRGITTLHILER